MGDQQQYDQYQPYGSTADTITEIAEQVMAERLSILRKQFESIADMKVFTDQFSKEGYDQRFLYKVSDSVFYSKDIKEVSAILEQYNIRYIFINGKMKEGGVWTRSNEGLLFLLSDQEHFKKIYTQGDVEIWQVNYPQKQ